MNLAGFMLDVFELNEIATYSTTSCTATCVSLSLVTLIALPCYHQPHRQGLAVLDILSFWRILI